MGLTLFLTSCQEAKDMEQQVNELYNRMSQPARIAQLQSMYMDELFDEQGRLDTAKCRHLIPYGIGHFSQFAMQKPRSPQELRDRAAAIQNWLIHHTPDGIPALLHEEVLTGVNTVGATIYPQQIGQACSFNPQLAEQKTLQTSTLMRKMGGVLSLSPMVDVCRVPSFNRLEESYGEDGYLSAVMGTAFVRGLQQGDLKKGVGACSKHYLGYGGGGDADEKELMEEILLPHEAMIRLAGSKAVMPGYHAVHGTKCVANSEILQDILRDYLGFDGMVVSDYTAIDQLPDLKTPVEKATAAINGGNDVDFPVGANYQHLQEALDQGLVKPETFERAVKDVLRYKFRAGLFDKDAYLYSSEAIEADPREARQTAYDIATQSVVLLENNGILPLGGEKGKVNGEKLNILLTGPNANSIWAMCGDYTYPAMSYFWKKMDYTSAEPRIVKLLDGMQESKPEGVNLMYSRGCDWTEEIETLYGEGGDERAWEYALLHRKVDAGEKADKQEALAMARQADVIVCAMGECADFSGESSSRASLEMPDVQRELLTELSGLGKPIVLLHFSGRPTVLTWEQEHLPAILNVWFAGSEAGDAISDVLFGDKSPSGKLTATFPRALGQVPLYYNHLNTGRPVAEGIDHYVKYASNYLDVRNDPLYPFGYGLSYTTFEYGDVSINNDVASVVVTNTGNCDGDEIVQFYIHDLFASVSRPVKELKGFRRIHLKQGESAEVSFPITRDLLSFYDADGRLVFEPGDFEIMIGPNSRDVKKVGYTVR